MAQDAIPTSRDETLLALITSIQSLTLSLQCKSSILESFKILTPPIANIVGTSVQPGLATPPPTVPAPSTGNTLQGKKQKKLVVLSILTLRVASVEGPSAQPALATPPP